MKSLKCYISEIYFALAIVYYWSLTALTVNFVAIGLLLILGLLMVTKNKVLGILIGLFMILINLYLILALLSEVSDFDTFNLSAKKLLIFGMLFIGLNLMFAALLLVKYLKLQINKESKLLNQ